MLLPPADYPTGPASQPEFGQVAWRGVPGSS